MVGPAKNLHEFKDSETTKVKTLPLEPIVAQSTSLLIRSPDYDLLLLIFKHNDFLLLCMLNFHGRSLFNKIVPTIIDGNKPSSLKGHIGLDQVPRNH